MKENYSLCVKNLLKKYKKNTNSKVINLPKEYYEEVKNCKEKFIKTQQNYKIEKQIEERIKYLQTEFLKKLENKRKNIQTHQPSVSFFKKAKLYFIAELYNIINGQVMKEIFEKRKSECLKCEGRTEIMEGKTDPGGIGFCSLCGCGASKRAALSVKLSIGGITCPLNKWEPVQGTEWSLKNVYITIFGIFSSCFYYINQKIKSFIGNISKKLSI